MNDFLDDAGARPSQHELLTRERDEAAAKDAEAEREKIRKLADKERSLLARWSTEVTSSETGEERVRRLAESATPWYTEAMRLEIELEKLRKGRDDARAEADRLRAELGRLVKERDEALAEAMRFRKLKEITPDGARFDSILSVTPPGPCQGKAEIIDGLDAIAKLIDAPAIGFVPGNIAHRLARIGLIVGRLIAVAR